MQTSEFVEAFPTLNLAEIREQIETREAELDELIRERRQSIDALKKLEELVDLAQNGPKPKAPRKPRASRPANAPASPPGLTLRQRAAVYLSANGATKFLTLAEELNCASNSLYKLAADDPWFMKDGPCLVLTDVGRRSAA